MWWLLVALVGFFAVQRALDWNKGRSKKYPPGPQGLPLIGNLIEVGRLVKETGFHWAAWHKLAKRYGPVLRVRLALARPLVIVSGREAVLEFLGKREFDGRPDTFEMRNRCLGKRRGVVCTDGPGYSELKKFALKSLKDFGYGKQPMEKLLLEDVKLLCGLVQDELLDRVIDVHDFVEVSSIAVVSSLWNIMAGTRCDPSKPDSDIFKILRVLKESFRNGSTSGALWQHIPLLRYIMPKYSGFAAQNKRVNTMAQFFLDEVANHKKTWVLGEPRDMIDKYLDEIEFCDNNKSILKDELELNVLVKDLFSAAIDTTSSTLGFTVAYLAKYPHIQEKVQKELDQVVGEHELPRLEHKQSLPYLNAMVAEVQRMASVAPTTIAHRAMVDTSVMGYDVEKDWTVIGDLRGIHMDPNHWEEPETFNPERFIDATGAFVEDPWLIPFGAGRRKCLGENLARMSLFLFHASLLQRFKFELAPGETASKMLGINGFIISPPHMNVIIKSRWTEEATS